MVCLARAAFAAGALLTCTAALADPSSDPTPTLEPSPFAQHGSPGAARHAKRLRIKRSPDFLDDLENFGEGVASVVEVGAGGIYIVGTSLGARLFKDVTSEAPIAFEGATSVAPIAFAAATSLGEVAFSEGTEVAVAAGADDASLAGKAASAESVRAPAQHPAHTPSSSVSSSPSPAIPPVASSSPVAPPVVVSPDAPPVVAVVVSPSPKSRRGRKHSSRHPSQLKPTTQNSPAGPDPSTSDPSTPDPITSDPTTLDPSTPDPVLMLAASTGSSVGNPGSSASNLWSAGSSSGAPLSASEGILKRSGATSTKPAAAVPTYPVSAGGKPMRVEWAAVGLVVVGVGAMLL